jgi:hypothetical protein
MEVWRVASSRRGIKKVQTRVLRLEQEIFEGCILSCNRTWQSNES